MNIPVTGTFPGGTFQGLLDITGFVVQQGTLFAQGVLEGQFLNPTGQVIRTLPPTEVLIPVTDIFASRRCEVLFLDLGPIELRLLGLNVDISRITIRITADPSGGILGQLLCAIADAFDAGDLARVAQLLNQLLDLF